MRILQWNLFVEQKGVSFQESLRFMLRIISCHNIKHSICYCFWDETWSFVLLFDCHVTDCLLWLIIIVVSGRPLPQVHWVKDGVVIDDTYTTINDRSLGFVIENEIVIKNLSRSDLNSVLSCEAINSNLTSRTTASVRLDFGCEYSYPSHDMHVSNYNLHWFRVPSIQAVIFHCWMCVHSFIASYKLHPWSKKLFYTLIS